MTDFKVGDKVIVTGGWNTQIHGLSGVIREVEGNAALAAVDKEFDAGFANYEIGYEVYLPLNIISLNNDPQDAVHDFKVGDLVTPVDDNMDSGVKYGHVYTVTGISSSGSIVVDVDGVDLMWGHTRWEHVDDTGYVEQMRNDLDATINEAWQHMQDAEKAAQDAQKAADKARAIADATETAWRALRLVREKYEDLDKSLNKE